MIYFHDKDETSLFCIANLFKLTICEHFIKWWLRVRFGVAKSSVLSNYISNLTLIWMGFLGVRFEVCVCVWRGEGGKITPRLKPVRIMLETSNLPRNYTPIFSFKKYTSQCLGPLNFADVSIFLQKISCFCPRKYLYSKQ